ncbi:MAG: glycerol-3-phosphate 1-O-acyltransferase PlsY [Candidatus Omnitrophica bacterium]|nr:glycerol-3-phosphate 1-O-acyltransferase PlsY [Candidatus Omnitrophota bacterium]
MLQLILAILVSYLLGSIPTAYIFGRCLKGIDIRRFGSGNVGATNAFRVLGKVPGIIILLLDILKGFVSVFFLGNLFKSKIDVSYEIILIILGLACISGHNWMIFLRFKGGKGVATSLGVLLAFATMIPSLRMVFFLVICSWLAIFLIFRIVSLASVLTGLSLPLYMIIFKQSLSLILTGVIIAIFILLRHRSNLKRILQGKEPRLF